MKITALFLICLISATFAISKHPLSQVYKNIESLRKDKTWSKIVLTLAELHMMSDSPLNDLIDALESLVQDLNDKSQAEEQSWQERQSNHNAEVGRLNGDINSAVEDVSNTQSNLDNNLYPRRSSLQQSIAQAKENIENNNQRLAQLQAQRENDHNEWVQRVDEHKAALDALEEAVNLLKNLAQEGNSFVQVKFSKQNLNKVTQKLGKHLHETLAKALLSVATSEFADVKLVREVIQKLSDIRQNIQNSLLEENRNEERQDQDYNDEVERLNENNRENQVRQATDENSLDQTNYSIEEQESFLAQRNADLQGFREDLQRELDNFQRDQEAHNDLAAQLASEVNAASEALNILQNGEFSEYIRNKIGGGRNSSY